jgi:uncharacterized protein (TIGR00725 family)
MRLKIGVMAFSGETEDSLKQLAQEVGKHIAQHDCTLITGATTGIPLEAAKGAKSAGGNVIGISPATSERGHTEKFHMPTDHHDTIIYTGFGYIGRNVINIRSADAIVIINGGVGTLNEFTAAYAEGRPIGVLEGSKGIADLIPEIQKLLHDDRRFSTPVIFEKDPKALIETLIKTTKDATHYAEQDSTIHPLG